MTVGRGQEAIMANGGDNGRCGSRDRWTVVGAAVGGVAAVFVVGAVGELVQIAIGAGLGWAAGLAGYVLVARRQRERRAFDLRDRSHAELMQEARELDVPGRSQMSKEELAAAIVSHRDEPDTAAQVMQEAVEEAGGKARKVMRRTREKLSAARSNGSHGSDGTGRQAGQRRDPEKRRRRPRKTEPTK